jgi:circadian clock protein KaiC
MSDPVTTSDELRAAAFTGAEPRDRTGVLALDVILGGGLPRGSLVLIMGLPGSGKTTLASQIGFTAAAEGKTTLILTALSESTNKLIHHLSAFHFLTRR